MTKINLAIVDDHNLFRNGLKLLLSKSCDDIIEGIFEAENGEAFLNMMKNQEIDVVLMDIDMPGLNGIETTRKSLVVKENLKIIALTMYGDDDYYLKMINAGAAGFLLKDAEISEVKKAIIKVIDGETYFPGNILYQIIKVKPLPNLWCKTHIYRKEKSKFWSLFVKVYRIRRLPMNFF